MSLGKPTSRKFPKKKSISLGILQRARLMIPRKELNQLYFSFVHSYLNYANLGWDPAQKINLSTLYRQQKHSMRFLNLKDQF